MLGKACYKIQHWSYLTTWYAAWWAMGPGILLFSPDPSLRGLVHIPQYHPNNAFVCLFLGGGGGGASLLFVGFRSFCTLKSTNWNVNKSVLVYAVMNVSYRPKLSLASLVKALSLLLSTRPSSMSSLSFRLLYRRDPTNLEKRPPCGNEKESS